MAVASPLVEAAGVAGVAVEAGRGRAEETGEMVPIIFC